MRAKKRTPSRLITGRRLALGIIVLGTAVYGAYYFVVSHAETRPQNPDDWAAYAKVQIPDTLHGIATSHTNSLDGDLNQYKQTRSSGTTFTVSVNGAWDLRTDNGPWQVLVRLDYDPEYLRANTVSCTAASSCYNTSVTASDIKAALNAQSPPLIDPNRTGVHSSGVTSCFDVPKLGSAGSYAPLYTVSLSFIKDWPGIRFSNTQPSTQPTVPVGRMWGIARGSCKTNTNASGAGWQTFDTTTCGNGSYHYQTGQPWHTNLECNYGPDPGGAAYVGFGEKTVNNGANGTGNGTAGSGGSGGGSTGKSGGSSGGSSKQADKRGASPESASQGEQKAQQKPELSPFYDGKQYAAGSDADSGLSGAFATLSSKKMVRWWLLIAVAAAVTVPAAYLYFRRHPKLLQKSPLSRILKNR